MINNSYFDPRFNSFGLHHKITKESNVFNIIFFDYEFCYDPFLQTVFRAINGELVIIAKFEIDPFSILTRQLKSQNFSPENDNAYISLIDKEYAAKLRAHFNTIIKTRIENFKEQAKIELKSLNISESNDNVNTSALAISSGHTLRDVTSIDVKCFKKLHHSPKTFISDIKNNKNMYIAQDNRGKQLIFELIKLDSFHNQIIDFFHQKDELNFNLYNTDDDGFSLLDNAITSGAYKNAEYLLKKGFKVNHQTGLGFTALHRAYSLGNDEGKALLIKHGAKTTKNHFGQTPLELSSSE